MERVLARQDRQFRRAFDEALRTIRDRNTLDQLASLLERGAFEEALDGLRVAAEALGGQYGASLSAAADDAAVFLSSALDVQIRFDRTNERAVQMIRRNQLRLIREFTQETRDVTRAALLDGIERGLNPRDQARLFRESIGLTRRQEEAVRNFRRLLQAGRDGAPSTQALDRALRDGRFDRSIARAIREGDPLDAASIERMVDRYRARYIKYRSEVIGRTEALRSVHQGTEEMYQQAIDLGEFRPDQITRTWVTARDERVRSSHAELGGQERPYNEGWEARGGLLMFPGDPNAPPSETIQCRCVLSTRVQPPSQNRNVSF